MLALEDRLQQAIEGILHYALADIDPVLVNRMRNEQWMQESAYLVSEYESPSKLLKTST